MSVDARLIKESDPEANRLQLAARGHRAGFEAPIHPPLQVSELRE
jgi:hypothetical protein